MTARIYRPAPSAMQSGRGKSKQWVLVHEPASAREIEPLMGYTATTDTQVQVRLNFETLEEAEGLTRAATAFPTAYSRRTRPRPSARATPTISGPTARRRGRTERSSLIHLADARLAALHSERVDRS